MMRKLLSIFFIVLLVVGCQTTPSGVPVSTQKNAPVNPEGFWIRNDRLSADKGHYLGEYKDGKRDGQGTCTFANGDKYDGDWENGNRHGYGIYETNKVFGVWFSLL